MDGTQLSAYRIVSELGSGGMGRVYRAEVEADTAGLDAGTAVALKVIHPHLLETPGFFKRFLREAQIGQQVQHDNVVKTFDCDATLQDGVQQNFLVMEYVEGQTLRDLLTELERVPEELCRHVGREIAKGLAAIHEAGVVHRDIKPENVLITQEHVVKVMDLGVARLQDEAMRLSQTGAFVGSLEYAAPEQFMSGGEEADGRADLHALGLVLYELSTGQHPYRDDDAKKVLRNVLDANPRRAGEVNPQLSPFFEEVVHQLLAKQREGRFATAAELADVFDTGEASGWWKERAKTLRIETKKPLRRIRVPRETALYGRDDDLAKLHALFDKAKAGDGQVLLVEGEAGIGKTRLVDEFVGRLRQEGEDINFLFGSYPPGGAATASGAFSTAYREQFGDVALEDTLVEYLTPTPVLIPAFAALLRGETSPKDAEPLTKDSLQTVFVHATRALAEERPTVVLIDDLHFAPEDGRALFASLTMAAPGHRFLLIGTSRPGISEDWAANLERRGNFTRRGLQRLGPKDLVALLKDSFRSERLAEKLSAQVSVKSDGNPFFAFEIIRGLREGQFITQEADGTWVSTQVIEDIEIPSSVMELIQARLSDLSDDERNLLEVAACCGFGFDPVLVGSVLGIAAIPALQHLGRVEKKHRLVRSAGMGYVFDHHQVQEALYEGLHDKLREQYHVAVAEALEARTKAAENDPKELDGAWCVDLCQHFLKGARGERALRYLDAALDHLGNGYLNDQAIALADGALAVEGLLEGEARLDVLLKKNGRLQLLGRREAQDALLSEARALAEAEDAGPLLAKVEMALSELMLTTGRNEEAREHLERARKRFEEAGDAEGLGKAMHLRGTTFFFQSRLDEARDCFERALATRQEIGDTDGEAASTINQGLVLLHLDRSEEAEACMQRGIALAHECGNRLWESNALVNLGAIKENQGRLKEALSLIQSGLAMKRELGDRRYEATARGAMGTILLRCGRLEEARAHLERALAGSREVGDVDGESSRLAGAAACAAQAGEFAQAQRQYEQSISLGRETGFLKGVVTRLSNLAGILLDQGQAKAAAPFLEEALTLARELGAPMLEVQALCQRALLPGGDVARAEEAVEANLSEIPPEDQMQSRFLLFKATKDATHLAETKRLLDYLVEHAPEEYRKSMLENVRLHRDIMKAWNEQAGS